VATRSDAHGYHLTSLSLNANSDVNCSQGFDTAVTENQFDFVLDQCALEFSFEVYPIPSAPWVPGKKPDVESKTMFLYFQDPYNQKNVYGVDLVRQ